MAGTISIVLKAIDKYSGVITGLNQGFELLGKALSFVKGAAETAFSAISTGAQLAAKGGAFDEQRNQFENLAKSYKLSGQDIIDTVRRTSFHTVSEFDSIVIATKAVAAGLKGKDLDTALSYIKRWTEATGDSFQSASERIFTSLSSGRYSVLRQMGLIIENGAGVQDVVRAMAQGLTRFGDSGFNAADKMAMLSASQEDFTRKIGQGINRSTEYQSILTGLSNTVFQFVNRFDSRPITAFLDFAIRGFKDFMVTMFTSLPVVGELWQLTWDRATLGSKDFSKNLFDVIFRVVKFVAEGFNQLMDIVTNSGLITALELLASGAIGVFGKMAEGLAYVVGGITSTFGELLGSIAGAIDYLPESVIKKLGISPEDLRGAQGALNSLGDTIAEDLAAKIVGAKDGLSSLVADISQGMKGFRIDVDGLDDIRDLLEDKYLTTFGADFSKEAQKGIDEAEKILVKSLSRVNKIALEDGTVRYLTQNIENLEADSKRAVKALDEYNDAQKKVGVISFGDRTFDLKGGFDIDTSKVDRALDDLDERVNKRREVKVDAETIKLREEIKEMVARTDWPTEFRGMMELFLSWILAKASGETVPLAITTG